MAYKVFYISGEIKPYDHQEIRWVYPEELNNYDFHVTAITETVLDAIKNSLAKGERVEIRDFGNFSLRKRNPRKARNLKTGVIVDVPPKSIPFFKAGKKLKEMVNS